MSGRRSRGAVVVTGASTGIGAACLPALRDAGFEVFAGVRREGDRAACEAAGARSLLLDVTDPAAIESARAEVEGRSGGRVAGVVNNAGIVAFGPLEEIPLEEIRQVLEVNALGAVALTRAFLPALRAARGRIVMISSVNARIASPFLGPYAASKFALEAFSDSLRREVAPFGVRVSVIQPGPIATPIWGKTRARFEERYHGSPYRPRLESMERSVLRSEEHAQPARLVADAVVRAMTARNPAPRVLVARAPLVLRLLSILPDRLVDRIVAWRVGG